MVKPVCAYIYEVYVRACTKLPVSFGTDIYAGALRILHGPAQITERRVGTVLSHFADCGHLAPRDLVEAPYGILSAGTHSDESHPDGVNCRGSITDHIFLSCRPFRRLSTDNGSAFRAAGDKGRSGEGGQNKTEKIGHSGHNDMVCYI